MFSKTIFKSLQKSASIITKIVLILLALFLGLSTFASFAQDDDSTACTVSSSATVNLRAGPSTDYAQQGQLSSGQTGEVDGQILGVDGLVWWRLTSGVWVRSDVVDETGDCEGVSTIAPREAVPVYDDFEDTAFDGAFNTTRWQLGNYPDFCHVEQTDGTLLFNYDTPEGNLHDCSLMSNQPYLTPLDELGGFEARIQISSDHTGGEVSQRIAIFDELAGGDWGAYCGLVTHLDEVKAFFWQWQINDVNVTDIDVRVPADYDQWYTFRLEVHPETYAFSCFMDDTLLGTFIPHDLQNLRSLRFRRVLEALRYPDAMASTYVDDVKIFPLTAETATPVPDPYLYDDFDDVAYDGGLNDTLWSASPDDHCQIFQEDGVMTMRNTPLPDYSFCVLAAHQLPLEPIDDLGGFQAKVMIPRASAGGFVTQVFSVQTDDIDPGHWAATCGLAANGNDLQLHFDVTHWGEDTAVGPNFADLDVNRPAQFDRWYTVRIEVDPVSFAFSCYADDELVGTVIPTELDILQDAMFYRHFKIDRQSNASPASTFIDDVRVIPPAE